MIPIVILKRYAINFYFCFHHLDPAPSQHWLPFEYFWEGSVSLVPCLFGNGSVSFFFGFAKKPNSLVRSRIVHVFCGVNGHRNGTSW